MAMPCGPWQAMHTVALPAPAAASPRIGACPRRSRKAADEAAAGAVSACAWAWACAGRVGQASTSTGSSGNNRRFMRVPSQLDAEHGADQRGAVMQLRAAVGVDAVVVDQRVVEAQVVPVEEA